MAACNALPCVFTLVLSMLLILQLLVSFIVPRDTSASDFTVISISSDEVKSIDSSVVDRRPDGVSALWPDEETALRLRAYADENELNFRQATDRKLVLQPWASGQPSFSVEVQRLVQFITTPEVNCSRWQGSGESGSAYVGESSEALCLNYWDISHPCVTYSFSLDGKDASILESTLSMRCEVHRFDPSTRHKHSSGSGLGSVQHHQAWLDWRRPSTRSHRRVLGTIPRSLVDIMNSLGHSMVHVLWADLKSAEWRVLESWVQDGSLRWISQLILTVHLQWAGFEVGGTEAEVVRFWYSVLIALHSSGFRLTHSAPGPGHTVLRQELPNTHSSYKLTWIRRGYQSK